MAQNHTPAPVDSAQIARAEDGWHSFVKYGKWFTLHVIALLVLMAIFLI